MSCVGGGGGIYVAPRNVGKRSQFGARRPRGAAGCKATVLTGWVTGRPSILARRSCGERPQVEMSSGGEHRVRWRIMGREWRAVARMSELLRPAGAAIPVVRDVATCAALRASDLVACRDERRSSVAFCHDSLHKKTWRGGCASPRSHSSNTAAQQPRRRGANCTPVPGLP